MIYFLENLDCFISSNFRIAYLIMIYKMLHNLLPNYLIDSLIFTIQIHNINTRQHANNTFNQRACANKHKQTNKKCLIIF